MVGPGGAAGVNSANQLYPIFSHATAPPATPSMVGPCGASGVNGASQLYPTLPHGTAPPATPSMAASMPYSGYEDADLALARRLQAEEEEEARRRPPPAVNPEAPLAFPSHVPSANMPLAQQQAPVPSFVVKTGHCSKEGGFIKSWRRRFLLLDDRSLRYYVPSNLLYKGNPHGANLKGTIPLHSIAAVIPVGGELHVATKGGRTYKLRPEPCAEDPIGNAVGCWAAALQRNIAAHAAAQQAFRAWGAPMALVAVARGGAPMRYHIPVPAASPVQPAHMGLVAASAC